MTSAVTDYGILLKRSGTTIGEVVNITPPKRANPTVEATSHSSSGVREYISSALIGMSSFTASVNFISDTTQDTLYADIASGTAQSFSIVFPGSMGTWAGSAIVTEFAPQSADAKSPKALTGVFTFQPTGAWTLS